MTSRGGFVYGGLTALSDAGRALQLPCEQEPWTGPCCSQCFVLSGSGLVKEVHGVSVASVRMGCLQNALRGKVHGANPSLM